jgi:hypothetical protein
MHERVRDCAKTKVLLRTVPADGMRAAAEKRDFGTPRWQLQAETTPLFRQKDGPT